VPRLISIAREKGFSAYVGDGVNRWSAMHRLDAARLFRLALESAKPGTRLHGVAKEGVPFRVIAKAIGAGLGIPVRSLTQDEAPRTSIFWRALSPPTIPSLAPIPTSRWDGARRDRIR
jgi:nucleoside-diphosphate-sugar epimerase